ncbi:pilin [Candidatus Parcubacteria bacterium]|nr:pilin [Candidatus Parcubacteria bacterium]
MKTKRHGVFAFLLLLGLCLAPHALSALTDYNLLEPLPFDGNGLTTTVNTGTYIAGLFRLVIALAGAIAVLRLIYAGIVYMSTDAFGKKEQAKNIIQETMMGLALTLGAWVIVATILPPQEDGKFVFELSLPTTPLPKDENPPSGGGSGSCADCVPITVPHKEAPVGCASPGPCQISAGINAKLVALNKLDPGAFLVSESYPPTVQHDDPCHAAGTCVDATINSKAAADITKLINNAKKSVLSATYEVLTKSRFDELVKAGVPQVLLNKKANAEHFHIK